MWRDIFTPVQRLLAFLGLSIEMVIGIAVLTVILSLFILSGQGVRLGMWLEDRTQRGEQCTGGVGNP